MSARTHSVEGEQSLLGGLMLDQRAWDQIADVVGADDLYRADHRLIFGAVTALVERNQPPDAITVSEHLQRLGQLEAAGGLPYLARLVEDTPSVANIRAYARIVRDHAILRQLIKIGGEIQATATETTNVAEAIEHAQRCVSDIAKVAIDVQHRGVQLISAVAVTPKPIRWLWRDYLARGKVHIVAGAPGTGKTTIAAAFAATLTSAGVWPDGSRAAAANVLIWSGEDSAEDTLVPRLIGMNANRQRIYFVGDVAGGSGKRAFDPAQDMPRLLTEARRIGDVGLLILDPVVSAVSTDSHKNGEVRRALQPVVDLASELDAAVLGISHYTKGTAGRDPVERVTGSVAFGALPRLVFGVAKSTNETGATGRVFVRAKSNVGPDGGGFRYELREREVLPGITTSIVLWGERLEGAARALLAATESVADDERTERDDVIEWLRGQLSDGPISTYDLQKIAKLAGFSWRTVERVKAVAGVKAVKARFSGKGAWQWALDSYVPTQAPLKSEDHHPGDVGGLRDSDTDNSAESRATVELLEDRQRYRHDGGLRGSKTANGDVVGGLCGNGAAPASVGDSDAKTAKTASTEPDGSLHVEGSF